MEEGAAAGRRDNELLKSCTGPPSHTDSFRHSAARLQRSVSVRAAAEPKVRRRAGRAVAAR